MRPGSQFVTTQIRLWPLDQWPLNSIVNRHYDSGVARSLVLAGDLLYARPLASRSRAIRARLRAMSGTNMVLWAGTCPARPALRYATALWACVARTPSMLGECIGTLCLYELRRKVQKHLGRAGGCPLREFWNFTASQVGSEANTVVQYKSHSRRTCMRTVNVRHR